MSYHKEQADFIAKNNLKVGDIVTTRPDPDERKCEFWVYGMDEAFGKTCTITAIDSTKNGAAIQLTYINSSGERRTYWFPYYAIFTLAGNGAAHKTQGGIKMPISFRSNKPAQTGTLISTMGALDTFHFQSQNGAENTGLYIKANSTKNKALNLQTGKIIVFGPTDRGEPRDLEIGEVE